MFVKNGSTNYVDSDIPLSITSIIKSIILNLYDPHIYPLSDLFLYTNHSTSQISL